MENAMKRNKIYKIIGVLASFFIVGLLICFCGLDNYNVVDLNYGKKGVVKPSFNVESGFYQNGFSLEISAPKDTTIYYTLDSSEPNINSNRYENPIYIDDASKNDNIYSMRTDVSAGFYEEYFKDNPPWLFGDMQFTVPLEKVKKCNVIRAIAVDKYGNKSEVSTSVYFVGVDQSYFQDVYVVSINTDPNNLFGYEDGIYVTGKVFDDYVSNNGINDNLWPEWPANYLKRGKEWERSSDVLIFDECQNLIYDKDAKIRVQGNYSRAVVPRSFNIFLNEHDVCFFDNDYDPLVITLAAGGNDSITKISDILMSNMVSDLHFSTMKYKPCILFLDGEYWGFYWIAERYNEDYIEHHYNVDKDNILMIKNGEVAVGDDSYIKLYEKMKSQIIDGNITSENGYNEVCEIIDMDSCIDYYATLIYIARYFDWPNGNYALWRSLKKVDDNYSDGKWRWMLFDCNGFCMSKYDVERDTLNEVIEEDQLFASLWESEIFKNEFEKRILDISDNYLDPNKVEEFINNYDEKWHSLLSDSWKRFLGDSHEIELGYSFILENKKEFFENRKAIVKKWFEK